ncbi:MAG: hypothetical protein HRF50_13155 [Phycisphaerae bacterium]
MNAPRNFRRILAPLAVFASLLACAASLGQTEPAKPAVKPEDLPKAEEILERFIQVTGGKAAYEKLKNRVTTGTIEVPAANIKGTMKVYHQAPDLMFVEQEMAGMGKSMEGYDGKDAWESSAMMGARLKEGTERAMAKRAAVFNSELNWRKVYKTCETVAVEDVDGKPAYKLVMTPEEGNPEAHFYDKESGLLVKIELKAPSPMGEIPVEIRTSDYRDVDGIKVAHKLVQRAAMQEVLITIDKIESNVDLPADRFQIPAEVREMLTDGQKPASAPASTAPAKKQP